MGESEEKFGESTEKTVKTEKAEREKTQYGCRSWRASD